MAATVLPTNPLGADPYPLITPLMCGATVATQNAKVGFVYASHATVNGRRTTNPRIRINSLSVLLVGSGK